MKDRYLILALIVSVLTYQGWIYLPKGFFYKGVALYLFILALGLYLNDNRKLTYFLLLCLSINNLLDELLFDPTKNGINELIALVLIPIIWYFKKNNKCQKDL
jgi:hypothetical protein